MFVGGQNQKSALRAVIFALCACLLVSNGLAYAETGSHKSKGDLEDLRIQGGDESKNEERAVKTELLITATENKAIKQVQMLIRKYKGTNLEPDLQWRLAEFYMRRAKTARFFEIHRQSSTVVSLAPQVVKSSSSRKHILQAVQIYDYIQSRYRRFHQLDVVIFNNAFARQQLGREKEAERLYWSLVQNFKGSALVPDSHLAIGEINFERGNFSFALTHFDAIRNFPDSKVYPYGLYKAAWSLYNLRKTEEGIKKLEEVVAYGKYVHEKNIESRLDLRKEALGDMTIFYEDVYPARDAFSYFTKQAGEIDVGPYILKLGRLYERHSRFGERQVVLNDFIKNIPESPHLLEIHNDLVWNYDSLKKQDMAIRQMESLYGLCKENSRWMKVQRKAQGSDQPDPRVGCLSTLHETALKLAGRWLKIWKKSPDKSGTFADSSEKAFEMYLREIEDNPESKQARFAYAELLFQRNKFRQASDQYNLVSSGPKGGGVLDHDARYASVVSLEKAVGDKWSDDDERRFHELAGGYIKSHKKGKYRLDIEFKLGLIAYEKNRYDEAGPIFLRLGKEFAKLEKGIKAQDLYLDILNIKKDYAGLREYTKGLLKVQGANAERLAKLSQINEQAWFMQVQLLEDNEKFEDAIKGYKEFAKNNPKSNLAETSWWNAVQLYYKKLDLAGGAQSAVEFYSRFPKSKNGLDGLLKAAQSYEDLGQLDRAGDVLIKIAEVDGRNETKWQVLAADFYLLSSRNADARRLLNQLRKNADSKVRSESLQKLFVLEQRSGGTNYQDLMKIMAKSGVEPQSSLAKAEIVEITFAAGNLTDAFNDAKKIIGDSSASTVAKSRARMIQARILDDEFRRQSVKSRADRVATVLAIKTEKLEKAQQAYQQAIKYGDPKVGVEALLRLARSYDHYVEALKTMPLPEGLTAADETAFREEISRLSIPLEEKAIETLQEALKATQIAQIKGDMLAQIKSQLKKFNMPTTPEVVVELTEPAVILPGFAGVGT